MGGMKSSPPAPKPKPAAPPPRATLTAVEMGARQREISVSEFFTKNRHLLGFDNPRKALLTCVKEAVDNALDACEEAGILPDVAVKLEAVANGGAAPPPSQATRFRITITDNGPGIVRQQIPPIFAKLLYGSKFHRLRMSRGQQGIGISAAGMYAQLTTGKPVQIPSRPGARAPAHYFEVQIDTKKNEPRILEKKQIAWESPRGTQVAMEIEGRYQKGRASVDEYLEQTIIANPHVKLTYVTPEGETKEYPRTFEQLPPSPRRSARRRGSRPTRGPATCTARPPRTSTRRFSPPRSWRRRPTASRPSASGRSSPVCIGRSRASSTRR